MDNYWPRISFDYSGIDVLVTGGTAGIGAGIAAAYAHAGAHVTITGTRASDADYSEDLSGYRYLQYRASEPNDAHRLVEETSKLDILVNNAGGTGKQPENFGETMEINLIATNRLSNAFVNVLAQSQLEEGSCIVNISSFYAIFASVFYPGYGAAKAGLVHLTKSHAANWASQGVRVNALIVGSIESRMTAEYVTEDEVTSKLMEHTPLARWGLPKDIAGAVLFLTSPAAGYITGESLAVDGGYCIIDREWPSMSDLSREVLGYSSRAL